MVGLKIFSKGEVGLILSACGIRRGVCMRGGKEGRVFDGGTSTVWVGWALDLVRLVEQIGKMVFSSCGVLEGWRGLG